MRLSMLNSTEQHAWYGGSPEGRWEEQQVALLLEDPSSPPS